jgi:flagellar biosynthesis/type III secretory pathway protein FliH
MKEPKTLFDTWLRRAANQALYEGLFDVDDVENLYTNVKEAAYQQGYKQGHSDGYAQAVADISKEGETE